MVEFRTIRKNGKKRVVPLNGSSSHQGITSKALSYADLKKMHIHGLVIAGWAIDLADSERHKAIDRAVDKYGKTDTMAKLLALRQKYEKSGKEDRLKVVDSDIKYIAGKQDDIE